MKLLLDGVVSVASVVPDQRLRTLSWNLPGNNTRTVKKLDAKSGMSTDLGQAMFVHHSNPRASCVPRPSWPSSLICLSCHSVQLQICV